MKGKVALIAVPAGLLAYFFYANAAAERHAQEFCAGIALGSDVQAAIATFGKQAGTLDQHYAYLGQGNAGGRHMFRFMGGGWDRAYCELTLNSDKQVIAKNAFFLAD